MKRKRSSRTSQKKGRYHELRVAFVQGVLGRSPFYEKTIFHYCMKAYWIVKE